MTRFARAEGSKSSNKKTCEDATPWQELKSSKPKNKIGKKKDFVIEDGKKVIVFKTHGKEVKRPYYDLPFTENEYMTRYKNFFVKIDSVKKLNDIKKSLEEEGLDKKTITKRMLTKERRAHSVLRVELLREQISKASTEEGGQNGLKIGLSQNLKKKFKRMKMPLKLQLNEYNNHRNEDKPRFQYHFEENDVMTMFEDHWVLKESVFKLQSIYNKKVQRIIDARTDGNEDLQLTEDEENTLRRLMKKEKRRENRLLKLRIYQDTLAQNEPSDEKVKIFREKKPGKYLGIEYSTENDMVKFDGFWIKKDGAERLEGLREKLLKSGVSEEEIQKIIKNERRKEERLLKHEKQQFCFRCRQPGHLISLCPQIMKDEGSTGVEICFKCGSTEHMARNCPLNKMGAGYAHATCFICNEVGHISRECPDNPKGLYPTGGCCNECGSVKHLKKDCPERMVERAKEVIKLPRLLAKRKKESIEEDDVSEEEQEQAPKIKIKKEKRKKAKTVIF